jgi:hypothetical protein
MWLEVVDSQPVLVPPERAAAPPGKEPFAARWGDWVFDLGPLTLTHEVMGYQIDLARARSSAAILDWVVQVLGKGWADAATVCDLLRAFDDLLQPQVNDCPWEEDRRAAGARLAKDFPRRGRRDCAEVPRRAPGHDFWLALKRPVEFLTSAAVGFPVAIYQCLSAVTGVGTGSSYQIMPADDREGGAFWDWHLETNGQFFATPLEAAEAFVRAFHQFHQGDQP